MNTNESNSVVNDDEDIFEEPVENVNRNMSPQPGPSHVQDIALPQQSRQSFSRPVRNTSVLSLHAPSSLSLGGQDVNWNMEHVDEDSDDNVEIVAEDKPWGDRSPCLLYTSPSPRDS